MKILQSSSFLSLLSHADNPGSFYFSVRQHIYSASLGYLIFLPVFSEQIFHHKCISSQGMVLMEVLTGRSSDVYQQFELCFPVYHIWDRHPLLQWPLESSREELTDFVCWQLPQLRVLTQPCNEASGSQRSKIWSTLLTGGVITTSLMDLNESYSPEEQGNDSRSWFHG